MRKQVVVFPDTNILLHFRPIEQIKWREILGCDAVLVVIARIVFNELDKKKWSATSAKIRERAGRVARELESYVGSHPTEIRPGESILLSGQAPTIDFAARGMDRGSGDDQLIASILTFAEQHPEHELVLVSDDTGPRVKADAHGIRAERLPASHRLKSEPDPLQSKVRKLQAELARIQAAKPELALRFLNKEKRATFRLDLLGPCDKERLEELVDRKRQELVTPDPRPGLRPGDIRFIPNEEYDRYNRDVARYLEEYRQYLRATWEAAASLRRRLRLELELVNSGEATAEDIDVVLHFPDGFRVRDPNAEAEQAPEPSAPREPVKPRNKLQLNFRGLGAIQPVSYPSLDFTVPDPLAPTIRRTNSYEVQFPVPRLKQKRDYPLPPLEVIFESDEDARSFHFTYRINAADLPKDEGGRLDVIVETDEA